MGEKGKGRGEEVFPLATPPLVDPCSWNECAEGHRWVPVLVVVKCPGCQSPYLADQKTNCPTCNEVMVRTSVRVDVVPRGVQASRRCSGEKNGGETLSVDLQCHQWREIAEGEDVVRMFEERVRKEKEQRNVGVQTG
jgi:hypothetical protein